MRNSFKLGTDCLLVVLLILCFAMSLATAAVFTVTNTNDTFSFKSLRGAVIFANGIGGKNTIILGRAPQSLGSSQPQSWVFHLTTTGADDNKSKAGDLDITRGQLTIIGATSNVVIDATGLGDRVFQVFTNAKLTLENVTITGGTAPGNIYGSIKNGEPGGAIINSGTLVMTNCVIIKNSSGCGNIPLGKR